MTRHDPSMSEDRFVVGVESTPHYHLKDRLEEDEAQKQKRDAESISEMTGGETNVKGSGIPAMTSKHTTKSASSPTQTRSHTTLCDVCADINQRVTRFLSAPAKDAVMKSTQDQTRVAISVIEQALQDYEFEELSLSYNGGKDCLVLLIIYLSVIHTHFTQPSGRRKRQRGHQRPEGVRREQAEKGEGDATLQDATSSPSTTSTPQQTTSLDFPTSIPSIYAKPPDPFDSVTIFVESSTTAYHLDLVHISTNPGPDPKSKSHSSPPLASTTLPSSTSSSTQPTNNISTTTPLTNGTPTTTTTSNKVITFRDAFALYLQTHPSIKAIFVGTRRTDPHGATLQHFQLTDGNWPRFMRVHPVIDWKLREIWCFLRSEYLTPTTIITDDSPIPSRVVDEASGNNNNKRTGLEYCSMYDQGYTSLGGVGDTVRNPRLRCWDPVTGEERYRPAYEMTEDDEERAGRE